MAHDTTAATGEGIYYKPGFLIKIIKNQLVEMNLRALALLSLRLDKPLPGWLEVCISGAGRPVSDPRF
ncbi:MAG: hypothetical protein KUL80_05545 [Comamonas sp.]|nr:hypothetical protein [Comamonas sp.]